MQQSLRSQIHHHFGVEVKDSPIGNILMANDVRVVYDEKFVLQKALIAQEIDEALEKIFGGKGVKLRTWEWGFKHDEETYSIVMVNPLEERGISYFWYWYCKAIR